MAATNVAANTFYLGRHRRFSRLFNALIVHESVHASFDLTRLSLPWIDNEAAAYIPQAYYTRNSGLPRLAFQFGSEAIIAYSVVQNMRAGDTNTSTSSCQLTGCNCPCVRRQLRAAPSATLSFSLI